MNRIALWLALTAVSLSLGGCAVLGKIFSKPETDENVAGKRVSVLKLEDKLEADPRISDVAVQVPPAFTNLAWPQPGGSPTNSIQHVSVPQDLKRAWSIDAGEGSDSRTRLTSVPVIADGRIYVLDTRATIRAFDEKNGRQIWEKTLSPEDEKAYVGFGGGVAFQDGRLFVTTGFGHVFALDAETGKEVWRRALGVPVRTAPTVFSGRVYVVATDNQLHAINERDGLVLWSFRGIAESAGVLSATSPAVDDQIVVAPFSSGELIAFRVQNGNQSWSDSLSRSSRFSALSGLNDIAGRPVIDGDRVIAVSHSGRMVSIDIRTGERIWTQNIASVQTPWVAGEFIYLVTLKAELVCLSSRDGRIRWISQLPAYEDEKDKDDPIQWTGPVLAGGKLYLLSSEEEAVMVSPEDGKVAGKFDLRDKAFLPPVVANETLFVLTDDGRLSAYREDERARRKRERQAAKEAETQEAPGTANAQSLPAAEEYSFSDFQLPVKK